MKFYLLIFGKLSLLKVKQFLAVVILTCLNNTTILYLTFKQIFVNNLKKALNRFLKNLFKTF